MPSTPRTDKIFGHLKSDGTYVWFRYDIDDAGAYQFLFQTGTSGADQALVNALAEFQNVLNYPGATNTTGSVLDPALIATVTFPDGSAAAPSITFTNDPDTGIYRPASNTIGFATGGVARFSISGSQFASAGGALFDMPAAGSIAITASGTNQNIVATPSGTGLFKVIGAGTTNTLLTNSDYNNTTIGSGLSLYFSGSSGNVISQIQGLTQGGSNVGSLYLNPSGGDVNIGGNSGTITIKSSLGTLNILDGNATIKQPSASRLSFYTATVLRGEFSAAGNFLIGTAVDSSALLQVGTNTTTSAGGIVFGTDTNLFRSAAGTLTMAAGNALILTGSSYVQAPGGGLFGGGGGADLGYTNNGVSVASGSGIGWTAGVLPNAARDTTITRRSAAVIATNSAEMIGTTVGYTNNAAAQVGTLNNAPVAGNPTSWLKINDNGTPRYIPAW